MNCAFCSVKLPEGILYFCRGHFFELPAPERMKIGAAHRRKGPMKPLLDRCVRILREKRTKQTLTAAANAPCVYQGQPKNEGNARVELPAGTPLKDWPTA